MGFPKQLQPILVPFGTVVAKPEYLRVIIPLHAIGDIHQGCEEVSSCSGRAAAAGWRFAACAVAAVAPPSLSLRAHVRRSSCMAPSRAVVHVSLFRCCRLGPSAAVRPLLAHSSRQLRGHRRRATHEGRDDLLARLYFVLRGSPSSAAC